METMNDCPTRNRPPFHVLDVGDNKRSYYHSVLINSLMNSSPQALTLMNKVALIMKYFFVYADLKDAVKERNGKVLGTLHKQLLPLFKSLPGFN